MGSLRALLLSDGRPGHFKLAEGILAAISRRRHVDLQRVDVRRRFLVPARAVSALVNQGASPALILRTAYGLSPSDIPVCDLVVSAGGNTLGANICAARLHICANIFYGSLRRFRAADFSLGLTSYATQVRAPNQLMTLKPSAFDPDVVGSGAGGAGEVGLAGFIVGGDAGTVRYSQTDWDRLFAFLQCAHEDLDVRWVISNSPRTPAVVSDRLAEMANGESDPYIDQFIDVRAPGAAALEAMFARVGNVVCTADSSSMLSECVWARKAVVAVSPADFSLPDNEARYRTWLCDNGWCRSLQIDELTPETYGEACSAVTPLVANPLERLADEIAERLPGLFA